MMIEQWVQGDGGPLIVLQGSAAAQWQGASDFDNSIMNSGSVETDYDIICQCAEPVSLISRYDRDMLVLSDSEWAGEMFASPSGRVTIIQRFYQNDSLENITKRADQDEATQSFYFTVKDAALRLLVGADDGEGSIYGGGEAQIIPGLKRCDVYTYEDGVVVTINTPEELTHDK